jgi:hypothetical protein
LNSKAAKKSNEGLVTDRVFGPNNVKNARIKVEALCLLSGLNVYQVENWVKLRPNQSLALIRAQEQDGSVRVQIVDGKTEMALAFLHSLQDQFFINHT